MFEAYLANSPVFIAFDQLINTLGSVLSKIKVETRLAIVRNVWKVDEISSENWWAIDGGERGGGGGGGTTTIDIDPSNFLFWGELDSSINGCLNVDI